MFSSLSGSVRWGLAMVFALQALAVDAQGPETDAAPPALSRPRICLVLSGGGARGAAHVGVLKVLEELRVPVHPRVSTVCFTSHPVVASVGFRALGSQVMAEGV